MKTLNEIYQYHKSPASWGDKGSVHSYIDFYEALFAPCRVNVRRMLEVGILTGESLRMWEKYFFNAEVHGVDACQRPLGMADLGPMIAEGTHLISLLDASDATQVEAEFAGKMFDVIVEDASHALEQQLSIYRNFKHRMAKGGIYVIEDIEDIDKTRPIFEAIDPEKKVEIVDRRALKGRFDDVLVVITDR